MHVHKFGCWRPIIYPDGAGQTAPVDLSYTMILEKICAGGETIFLCNSMR
jgi:hypothetical protein